MDMVVAIFACVCRAKCAYALEVAHTLGGARSEPGNFHLDNIVSNLAPAYLTCM